jgi:hypothetical protein
VSVVIGKAGNETHGDLVTCRLAPATRKRPGWEDIKVSWVIEVWIVYIFSEAMLLNVELIVDYD